MYSQSLYDPLQAAGADDPSWLGSYKRVMRLKNYELSDHLGNVLTVISDWKIGVSNTGNTGLQYYKADVQSAIDYYPFGMQMPGRISNASGYRYGYNGQEKDDEIYGVGNLNTAMFWEYETRLGRRWNVDPIVKPWSSGYSTFANSPIYFNDPFGDDEKKKKDLKSGKEKWSDFKTNRDQIKLEQVDIVVSKDRTKPGNMKTDEENYRDRYQENLAKDRSAHFRAAEAQYRSRWGAYDEGHYPQFVYEEAERQRLQDRLKYYQNNEMVADYGGRITGHGIALEIADPTFELFALYATFGTSTLVTVEADASIEASRIWEVGVYEEIKGVEVGLEAHHVGQSAVMKKFIPTYDLNIAPSILVPKVGHTVKGTFGIVSRRTSGFINARQVLARDIFELRRVYPNVPTSSLRQLVQMNKTMYPAAFGK